MAELVAADVAAYTNDRLDDGVETQRMLDAALKAARRETGWHVSPVITETVTLDGPNGRILYLPTRKLVELTGVEEDGVDLDLDDVKASTGNGPHMDRPVALRKVGARRWTAEYGGVVVEMDHGYTEVEAADWRQAILSMVDQMSLVPVMAATGTSAFGLTGKRVDDVDYRWGAGITSAAEDALFSVMNVIDDFRLPSLEFM